jgi:hypothetical protein
MRRSRLATKITVLIVVVLIVGFGVSTIWTLQREHDLLLDQSKVAARRLTTSIVASIEGAMLQERPDVTRLVIQELRGTSSVEGLTIYRRNGVEAFTDLATLREVEKNADLSPVVRAAIQKMRRPPTSTAGGPAFQQALTTLKSQESLESRNGVRLFAVYHPIPNQERCQGCLQRDDGPAGPGLRRPGGQERRAGHRAQEPPGIAPAAGPARAAPGGALEIRPRVRQAAPGREPRRHRVGEAECGGLRAFSSFLEIIQQHRGDVNETAGDGIMVVFQAERQAPDHALEATRAAFAIRQRAGALNEEYGGVFPPVQLHMGLNSGEALVGATKLGQRWTFTASGPTTNLAARFAGSAQVDEIIVGPTTAERIRQHFVLESLGERTFKNVSQPVHVYRVIPPGVYERIVQAAPGTGSL